MFNYPELFAKEDYTQYLTVYADFADFEPSWDHSKPLIRVKIPKQSKTVKDLSSGESAVMAAGASA